MDRKDNLESFFIEGKSVILPIDHGCAIPVPGLENPFQMMETMSPVVDGYVTNLGVALRCADAIAGKGICLRTDVYNTRITGLGAGSILTYGVAEAELAGANAVMNMLYPNCEDEKSNFQDCADLIRDSFEIDIPVIIEALPVGLGQSSHYTLDKVAFAARLACEMGADVVKIPYPVDAKPGDFKKIIDQCWIPVVILGGAAMNNDQALLSMIEDSIKCGGAGVAIGRNVWQHPTPVKIAKAIYAIVHEGSNAKQALKHLA
jgi:DhnA family fructose-bisphosphate aldolase class Ia